jgi:hypothetical protein
MRSAIPALICATVCFTGAFAQQPQAPPGQPAVTFKAEVNYVDVDTIVTDQQGNFVKGLTKDDFELLEDGKPQKVEMFSYVDLPLTRPDRSVTAGRPVVTLAGARSPETRACGHGGLAVIRLKES